MPGSIVTLSTKKKRVEKICELMGETEAAGTPIVRR